MNNFAFDKKNYLLLAIGMLIIIVGFILMSGVPLRLRLHHLCHHAQACRQAGERKGGAEWIAYKHSYWDFCRA